MKFIYPAVIAPQGDGFFVSFPDLTGCEAKGSTFEEAVENAHEAALDWINVELEEEVPAMPGVSEPDDIDLPAGAELRYIAVTYRFYDGYDE